MKLTEEQKERLEVLVETDVWQDLELVCRVLVRNHEDALLNAREGSDLSLIKARLDGARSVATGLLGLKEAIHEKRKKK